MMKNIKTKMEKRKTNRGVFSIFHFPFFLQSRGFTLIEMMVAVSIFTIVMMIGVGALLSLVEANQRAQAINSVVSNLNAAMEGMSRSIRVGTTYHCNTSSVPEVPAQLALVKDCVTGGGRLLAFESSSGNRSNVNDQVVYRINGTQLERSLDSGGTWVVLTAPEVSIESFQFFVIGSTPKSGGNNVQPRVVIRIDGSATVKGGTTAFSVQAGVTQRLLDI